MQKRRRATDEEERGLVNCAVLILPYLDSTDLASVSSTCKSLSAICKAITFRRSSDASQGFENFPIPFVNSVDSQPYSYFIYAPTQTLPSLSSNSTRPFGYDPVTRPDLCLDRPDPFLFRVKDAKGCECKKCDEYLECSCFNLDELLARECGPSCQCDSECRNQVSQRGILVKLKIVKHPRKGWSLYANELIGKGNFVCEYAGELLVTKEARVRQQKYDELASKGQLSPALLVVKEHLPSRNVCMRINIDATRTGNVARFINHSCDGGNLNTVLVRSSGALLPRICFFASRDVQENEELTFSYGDIRLKQNGLPCFCGSSCCSGFLPSENT